MCEVIRMNLDSIIRSVFENNNWINGWYDYFDGNVMAPINAEDDYRGYTVIDSIEKLYNTLRNYDGIFVYKNLIFAKHWNYGTFVYRTSDPLNYIEHLSIDGVGFDEFRRLIIRLLR